MPKQSPKENPKAIKRRQREEKKAEEGEAPAQPKTRKVDLKPSLAVILMILMLASTFYYVIDYFFPANNQTGPGPQPGTKTVVAKYGPFDVYSENPKDYYIYLNPEVEWHFRTNPVDALEVPVFPDKEKIREAVKQANEVWITYAPEEDPRIIVSAMEIAKTAGALNKTVNDGFIRQPQQCMEEADLSICTKPIIPIDFAQTGNRAVFRMLGPKDNVTGTGIFVLGNTTVIEAGTYDDMDLAADKVSLILLGIA